MRRVARTVVAVCSTGLPAVVGCSATRTVGPTTITVPPPSAVPVASKADPAAVVIQASYQKAADPDTPAAVAGAAADAAAREKLSDPRPAADAPAALPASVAGTELTAEGLVRAVLERNPTVEQMQAAAAAAAARYPQVTSLDDPSFGFNTAPFSAGSPNADYAARVEIGQKFLYPGKRGLKGQAALAEAGAANQDVEDTRLQLAEAAKSALADYYAAEKGRGVAEENLRLLGEFKKNAETRYANGLAPQQDVSQAEVEAARQEERLVSYRRARQVAKARINTLMHLPPDAPLPPPAEIKAADPLPDAAVLRAKAVAARPDLKAVADRLAADQAALALAVREYKPDYEVFAAYDGFWQGQSSRPLQWQVGMRMALPTRYARRTGAVAEAQAKVARRQAELARLADQVNLQVQEAYEQVRESDDVVALFDKKVLPAAATNVKEARAGYETGKVAFLNLVEAQRNVVGLKERYYEAVAETARRRAALERAVGGQ